MRRIRLLAPLMALFLLTVSVSALDVAEKPISNGGYTHYAIDSDGLLWAWGDSFHGGITADRDLEWEEAVPGGEERPECLRGLCGRPGGGWGRRPLGLWQ